MKRIIGIIITSMLLTSCGATNTNQTPPEISPIIKATASPDQTVSPDPAPTPDAEKKYVIETLVNSEAIAKNMINESRSRRAIITLPPSYYESSNKKYPVVYYLWGGKPWGHSFPLGVTARKHEDMAQKMKDGTANEFISVDVDCATMIGASFCANSPVTGNFEDFIVNELVQYMDTNYRTIPKASARGVTGFSMGGFGALYVGFRHPDVFSCVLALSPELFDKDGVKTAYNQWDPNSRGNYGAVFAPNVEGKHPFAFVPAMDGSEEDQAIIDAWYNGCGNWEEKVKTYLSLPDKLTAVKIMYGKDDSYDFIRSGCEYVNQLLQDNDIPSTLEIHNGWHEIPVDFIMKDFLPFFSKNLKTE